MLMVQFYIIWINVKEYIWVSDEFSCKGFRVYGFVLFDIIVWDYKRFVRYKSLYNLIWLDFFFYFVIIYFINVRCKFSFNLGYVDIS